MIDDTQRDARLWILVSGSRDHRREILPLLRFVLLNEVGRRGLRPEQAVLVHGAQGGRHYDGSGRPIVARGLDLLAAEVAESAGAATTARWPDSAEAAQPTRVGFMFPLGRSPRTRDCARKARRAGVEIHVLEAT